MIAIAERRFKSGDVCPEQGPYEFDGYLDGSSDLLPALEEMEILARMGQAFPTIRSQRRPCYWTPAVFAGASTKEMTAHAYSWL
ncbi:MAG: hypothetical protein HY287_18320 [Planctomycetes bacterium]|nr:hypothetical protein [Planctomycetota bacterium]MBI3836278.1 hypothetical protein [Planctomycetota bacterium]